MIPYVLVCVCALLYVKVDGARVPLCVSQYVYMGMCVSLCLVCLCDSVLGCVGLRVCLSVWVYMFVCVWVCVYVFGSVSRYICMFVFVSVFASLNQCVCERVNAIAYVWARVCFGLDSVPRTLPVCV